MHRFHFQEINKNYKLSMHIDFLSHLYIESLQDQLESLNNVYHTEINNLKKFSKYLFQKNFTS